MTIDTTALVEAARKATPGEWPKIIVNVPRRGLMTPSYCHAAGPTHYHRASEEAAHDQAEADADYIVAAQPSRILALCADHASLAAENARLREALEPFARTGFSCVAISDVERAISALSPERADAALAANRAEYERGVRAAAKAAADAKRAAGIAMGAIDPWHATPDRMKDHRAYCIQGDLAERIERAILALPLPSTAALDELRAQVRAEAFEECAAIARRGLHTPRAWLPETPTEAEAYSSLREAQEIEGAILARRGGAA